MKLSIITVNLNNKAGLQKTIDSVISQTFKDYEWIVIDGGSTDGSKELIEKYSDHISYWVSEPDKGIYNAMNKGIKKSNGDYLLFLNSGDELYNKDVLANIFDRDWNADIISGQVERMDNHKLLRKYDKSIYMQLYNDTINHQGSFIKRYLFNERLYDESLKIVSDWKFWVESIIINNASIEVTNAIITKQDMEGISSSNIDILKKERSTLLNSFFPPLLQTELEKVNMIKNSESFRRVCYIKEHNHLLYKIWYKLTSWLFSIAIRV